MADVDGDENETRKADSETSYIDDRIYLVLEQVANTDHKVVAEHGERICNEAGLFSAKRASKLREW